MAKQLQSFVHAMKARGTEDAPIVIRTDGPPVKYQCPMCRLWFVESWYKAMFRELDPDVMPRCQPCHNKAERDEWAKLAGEHASEWEKYGA